MPVAGSVFRVGEEYHSFEYQRTDMTLYESPVYRCIRSHDNRPAVSATHRLFLYRTEYPNGHWTATEAKIDATVEDIIENSSPKFVTVNPMDDIAEEGDVMWGWWDARHRMWNCAEGLVRFHTYNFEVGSGGGSAATASAATTSGGTPARPAALMDAAATTPPPAVAGPGTVVLMPSQPPIQEEGATAATAAYDTAGKGADAGRGGRGDVP